MAKHRRSSSKEVPITTPPSMRVIFWGALTTIGVMAAFVNDTGGFRKKMTEWFAPKQLPPAG